MGMGGMGKNPLINLKKRIAMGGNPPVAGNAPGAMPMMKEGGHVGDMSFGDGRHPSNKECDNRLCHGGSVKMKSGGHVEKRSHGRKKHK